MASKLTSLRLRPLISPFSTQCPPVPIAGSTNYEIHNTTLPNKIIVSSAENFSPFTRISIIFKAGARHEPPDNPGLSHTLRLCFGQSTKNASQLLISRSIQESGATLTCNTCRETTAYSLAGTRKAIEKSLPFLTEVATQHVFVPWKMMDIAKRKELDIKFLPVKDKVVDLLHKAAFRRGGLGNPLYTPEYNIQNITADNLQEYVSKNFTPDRTIVTALGVDHSDLVKYAQKLQFNKEDSSKSSSEDSSSSASSSPYIGGELRLDQSSDYTVVALATQGTPFNDLKDMAASQILTSIMFENSGIRYGSSRSSLFSKAASGVTDSFQFSTLNYSYTDEGLLGICFSAPRKSAGKLVEAAAQALKSEPLEESDFKRGKNPVLMSLYTEMESGASAFETIGKHAVFLGTACSVKDVAEIVESVTLDDVNEVLEKVKKGKLSLAAIGNLGNVPFLDELKQDS